MAGPLICVWQWWVFVHQVIPRGNKFFLLGDIDQELLFVHTFCSQPALLPTPILITRQDSVMDLSVTPFCYSLLTYIEQKTTFTPAQVFVFLLSSLFLPTGCLLPRLTRGKLIIIITLTAEEEKKKLNQSFMLPDWVASTNDLYILNIKWIVKTMS